MKLKLNFIIIIFVCCVAFSQKNIKIEYEVAINTDLGDTIKQKGYLYVNKEKDKTFYITQIHSSKKNSFKTEEKEEEKIVSLILSSGLDDFNYIDYKENQIITREDIIGKSYLIKENLPILYWKLSNETKTLYNVLLNKATCYFRGRNYTAWYSVETPLGYGPWKFYGLPGLIYEIYDQTHKYTWILKKVEFTDEDFEFSKIINEKDNFITIKKYAELKFSDKSDNIIEQQIRAIVPRGAIITRKKIPRSGKEIKFEWETEEE